MSRRAFLGKASLALAAQAFASRSLLADNAAVAGPSLDSIVLSTPSGKLRGIETGPGARRVRIFRGVPFAQPPVGPLRFRPPVKIGPWSGERDATRFSASPVQPGEPGVQHSEDCLHLNLWAPKGKGPFPVFVWIHGGGFTGGHAFEPIYDGTEFARSGVLCIAVAYRLGVFGFLDWEPLLGSSYAGSANNALRDLMLALKWIHHNVAAFGGDPSQVTIGGESAGAKLTDVLMGIPAARHGFHQMISESGGADRVWSLQNSQRIALGYGDVWRQRTGQSPASAASAPAPLLLAAQQQFLHIWPQHFPLRPQIDGDLLRQFPLPTIASGNTRGKRLLIGTNRDESALFIGPHPQKPVTAANLGNVSLEAFQQVFAKYKALCPHMPEDELRIRALSAEEYWVPSVRVAQAHVRGGGKAWMYRLDFAESSGGLRNYAYHSLDVGMVWNKPHRLVGNAAAEAALGRQIHAAWVAFLQGKSPAAPGLPEWPQCDNTTRATMILNTQSHVENQPQQAELRLWDNVL